MTKYFLVRIATVSVILLSLGLASWVVANLSGTSEANWQGISPWQTITTAHALTGPRGSEAISYPKLLIASGDMGPLMAALPIVLIAGFAETIGHAAILFANRVRPNRFAITVLFNTALFVVNYLIWVEVVSLVSFFIFERDATFVRASLAVGIAYYPLIYGFLIALPYIGVLISNILYLIMAINLVQLLQVFFAYSLPEAMLCSSLSLLAAIGFRLTIGRPISWVRGRLLNVVAGTPRWQSVDDALAYIESKGTEA